MEMEISREKPLSSSPTFQREKEREKNLTRPNFDPRVQSRSTNGENVTRIFITFDEKKFLEGGKFDIRSESRDTRR